MKTPLTFALMALLMAAPVSLTAEPVPGLVPGSSFSVTFDDMPPTFYALFSKQDVKAKMTICLPHNYDPAKKHPLLVFLNGWDGGDGNTLGVARGITGQQDFVCVSMPLFRAPGFTVDKAGSPGKDFVMTEPDGRAMWPLFKTMLDKVEALVPNIDKSQRVVGGSSNGAHATAALIDGSDGEICKHFSAFLMVEGGGKLQHFEHLKGKLYMMVSSQSKSKPRALEIIEQAKAAGARTTFLCEDIGKHGFPVSAYPAVGAWLRGEEWVPPVAAATSAAKEEKESEQTKTGTVKKVDVDAKQLVVMAARELTFTITDSTQIQQNGKPMKLSDIKAEANVSVEYVREGEKRTAHKIVILKDTPAVGESIQNPADAQVQTATTHPMKYYLSLPKNWSANRTWPVLVAPNAHYGDKGKHVAFLAAERDARKADFIIVVPLVINADRVADMTEYRGAVADAISAADAASPSGRRDETARGKFDSEGIRAIFKDVQNLHHGEDKVYITGFSSSTHVAYMLLFTLPELLKGVIINSGVYLGRGVDEAHTPLMNSPERASLPIKYIVGKEDRGYAKYSENWQETKTKLIGYGHPASKMQMEVIKPGNPEGLSAGHNWFLTRVFDFCAAAELALQK